MGHHSFGTNPLRCAVSSASRPGKRLATPIRHTAAILAASTIGLTSGASIAAEGKVLEEIIVTATRREESLQDVAIPMTAVSGDALERHFAQDLRDLTNAAPNVQLEPVGIFQNSSSFFIRGQGTGDIESAADSKVGVYVDGVYQARVSTGLSDMLDVSSVEILRGPQGTLFGRNTIAGAVQILHHEPEMNEFGTRFSAQVGDFGRFDAKGIVNIPMVDDTLAGRIAVKRTKFDGYWRNSENGKRRGGTDRWTVNPTLKWTPNDQFKVVTRGEWSRSRDDTNPTQSHNYCRDDPANFFGNIGFPGFPQGGLDNDVVILTETLYNWVVLQQDPATAAAGAASICAKPLEHQSAKEEFTTVNTEDRGQRNDIDVWGITLQADYQVGDLGDITYIGNYRDVDEDIIFQIDTSHHDIFAGNRIQDHYQTSHELRFASGFSDRFDFVAGMYYFEQEYRMKQSSWGILFAPNVIAGTPGSPSVLPGVFFPSPIVFTHPETYGQAQFSTQLNKAWAAFTQANWHVTDALTVTVGGRYTSETKKFRHCPVGAGNESLDKSAAKNAEGCNDSPAFVVDLTLPPINPPETGTNVPTPVLQLVPAIGFDASGGEEAGCRPVLDPAGMPIFCNNRLSPPREKWTDFTPMAGLTYRFNDDVMAYFTWSRGFTAGGWNGRGGTTTSIGPFDPEKGENFEVGLKSDWLDHRLRANLTAFRTKVKDFQTAFIRAAPGGGGQETIQSNLGSFKTKGAELELTALPTPELTVWANISYLKTKRVGFCTDPDGFENNGDPLNPPSQGGPYSQDAPVCGPPTRVDDAIGNFLGWLVPVDVSEISKGARAPKWTTTLGFAYEFNLSEMGTLTLSADWLYSAKSDIGGSRVSEPDGVLQFNGDFIKHQRDSYNIINASAIWRSTDGRYEVAAFGKNLTNDLYNQATTVVGGLLNFRNTNIRRHWAVELRVNLGA